MIFILRLFFRLISTAACFTLKDPMNILEVRSAHRLPHSVYRHVLSARAENLMRLPLLMFRKVAK